MAALSSAFGVIPVFLDNGTITVDMPKVTASSHCVCKSKITLSSKRVVIEERKHFCRGHKEIHRNLISTVLAAARVSVEQTEQLTTPMVEVDKPKRVSTFLFRTETGGLVKVYVKKGNFNYIVHIEVSSLQIFDNDDDHEGRLVMVSGVYKSDSSCFMPLEFLGLKQDSKCNTIDTPFVRNSFGNFTLELGFEAEKTPLYFSFVLKSVSSTDSIGQNIRSHRKTNFCVPVGFGAGNPSPLGLTFRNDNFVNFALFSRNSESVVLCLYDETGTEIPALELDLDPYVNRTGDVWHASLDGSAGFVRYGYKCKKTIVSGNGVENRSECILLDPYSKVFENSILENCRLGLICKEPAFNWSGDTRPNLPIEKLMVYRLNVLGFTGDESSKLPADVAGTFSGLTEKVHHLKDLGMNAVLLEPVLPFDEQKGPYFPVHFFSPSCQYGLSNNPISAFNSMKEMVKKFHANGIEVILEVVYTHTADSGALHGIDDNCYYYRRKDEHLESGNHLNCNYPVVQTMILESLRRWVIEFHIDGFCFINASSLLRGFHGEYLSRPPLIEAISFDPLLSQTKIVADSWNPQDTKPKNIRFPHWKRWAEINTKFCDDVRNFLRGEGLLSSLATRVCGSGDIFSDGRGPAYSFNYIARNSGLPLVDLVSFSKIEELSWNCGEEGATNKNAVLNRRLKQIRNFIFILYISLGVPVLNMGDESGHSSNGSPSYELKKHFDWNSLNTSFGIQITQFISFMSLLRTRRSDVFQRRNFMKLENIEWQGIDQSPPNWDDPTCKFLSMWLKVEDESQGDIFVAFNAGHRSESVILPLPSDGTNWVRLVDTALPVPEFFCFQGEPVVEHVSGLVAYEMKSYSCTLFEASKP